MSAQVHQQQQPPISSIREDVLFVDESEVFDPTNLKFRAVLCSFKPDKESTWHYPKDRDIWVHSHNAIRGDLQAIEECLEALLVRRHEQPLREWEVNALIKIYDAHDHFIYEHHTNEDGVMKPFLAQRMNTPHFPGGFDDHEALVGRMERLGDRLHALEPGKAADIQGILAEFHEYSTKMLDHLKEEEEFGLPLMRAYYTPKEVSEVVQKIFKNTSKLELGSIIYHMGEKRFRSEYMKQEGIPFFMWHTKYQAALKAFESKIVRLVEAVKNGAEP